MSDLRSPKPKAMAEIIDYVSKHGRSRYLLKCKCGASFWAYIWSFHGSGKRCPGCGVKIGPANCISSRITFEEVPT